VWSVQNLYSVYEVKLYLQKSLHLERTGRFIVDADVPALRQQILLLGFPELDADFVATTTELLKSKFGLRVLIIQFKETSKDLY
jgi:hypothetical protein